MNHHTEIDDRIYYYQEIFHDLRNYHLYKGEQIFELEYFKSFKDLQNYVIDNNHMLNPKMRTNPRTLRIDTHGIPRDYRTETCINCGNTFFTDKLVKKYCSMDCNNEYRRKHKKQHIPGDYVVGRRLKEVCIKNVDTGEIFYSYETAADSVGGIVGSLRSCISQGFKYKKNLFEIVYRK